MLTVSVFEKSTTKWVQNDARHRLIYTPVVDGEDINP